MKSDWQSALDIQMDQLKWQRTRVGEGYTRNFFENILSKEYSDIATVDKIISDASVMISNVIETLWRGDTMFVTEDMQHLILQAAHDLPDEYRFDMHTLLCPIGFCLLEETMYGEDKNGRTMGVSAISWNHVLHGSGNRLLVIHFWTSTHDTEDAVNQQIIPEMRAKGYPIGPLAISHYYMLEDGGNVHPGKDRGNPQGSELVDALLGLFAAMNILAHQTIGEPMRIRPDRASRKRYARDFKDAPERMITLITLRRKNVKVEKDPDAPPVPWSRRWVVRGHWRRQYYPKTDTHDWKYIYEYVKGPEDKPLIITERRVFNFRR